MRVTIEGVKRSLLARVQNPMGRLCGCAPTCWCQRSRLGRALRWYVPIGHRAVDPMEKRDFAERGDRST